MSRPGVGETRGRVDGVGWDVTDTWPGRGLAVAVVTFGGDGRATVVRFAAVVAFDGVTFASFCSGLGVACGPRCCLSCVAVIPMYLEALDPALIRETACAA